MWYQHWFNYFLEEKGLNAAMASMNARELANVEPPFDIKIKTIKPNVVFINIKDL